MARQAEPFYRKEGVKPFQVEDRPGGPVLFRDKETREKTCRPGAPYKNKSPAFVRALSGFRPQIVRFSSALDLSAFIPGFFRFYSGTGPVSLPERRSNPFLRKLIYVPKVKSYGDCKCLLRLEFDIRESFCIYQSIYIKRKHDFCGHDFVP